MILAFGISCGILGINAAHELGHRNGKWEKVYGQAIAAFNPVHAFFRLSTIEVTTRTYPQMKILLPPDTESGCMLFGQGVSCSAISVRGNLKLIACARRKQFGIRRMSMIQFLLMELMLNISIAVVCGWKGLLCYLAAAFLGILLLETVNYMSTMVFAERSKDRLLRESNATSFLEFRSCVRQADVVRVNPSFRSSLHGQQEVSGIKAF
jgi:alkane 1-monooxygenase